MVVNFDFLFGMAFGIIVFDEEDVTTAEAEWGFSLFLGPMILTIYKPQ